MRLQTLGKLCLYNTVSHNTTETATDANAVVDKNFDNQTALLLLTYLTLEGPTSRSDINRVFWPDVEKKLDEGKIKGRNSLNKHVHMLINYKANQDSNTETNQESVKHSTLIETEGRDLLISTVKCDASRYQETNPLTEDLYESYGGAFLQQVKLHRLSDPLKAWIEDTRTEIGLTVQHTMLKQVKQLAKKSDFQAAAKLAEKLYNLEGGEGEYSDLEIAEIDYLYKIFVAAQHPLSIKFHEIIEDFRGVPVQQLDLSQAQKQVRRVFIGRKDELAILNELPPGDWAWIQGGAKMGKSYLARQIDGRTVDGCNGLPYATLESFYRLPDYDERSIIRFFLEQTGTIVIDNWAKVDDESKAVLTKLSELNGPLNVVITSKEQPQLECEHTLVLENFSEEDLEDFNGAWEYSQGIPVLAGAFIRHNGAKKQTFDVLLNSLSQKSKDIYFVLVLLETYDLPLARKILEPDVAGWGEAIEELEELGFISFSGEFFFSGKARGELERNPRYGKNLELRVARCLKPIDALKYFKSAEMYWNEGDYPLVLDAYTQTVIQLFDKGFPNKALDLLEGLNIDFSYELNLLHADALRYVGKYKDALLQLKNIEESIEVISKKAIVNFRLGNLKEAKQQAELSLEGNSNLARAEALQTLAIIEYEQGNFDLAEDYSSRSIVLWNAYGSVFRSRSAQNTLGIVQLRKNHDNAEFQAMLDEIDIEDAYFQPQLKLNIGFGYDQQNDLDTAQKYFNQALNEAKLYGNTKVELVAYMNLGVVLHKLNRLNEALILYKKGMKVAQVVNDQKLSAVLQANLAELEENFQAWKEALRILKNNGSTALAERFINNLPSDHLFREKNMTLKQ